MLRKTFLTIFTLLLLNTNVAFSADSFDSHYSSIAENDCQTLKSDDQSSTQHCASFAGLSVMVSDFDARQDIIFQQEEGGKRFPLNLSQTVSSAFSALGEKIEWRHKKGQKSALAGIIVRFNVSENVDKPDKTTSYLVVSKATADEICVVGKVPPQTGNKQNQLARSMAEKASTMPCIQPASATSPSKSATKTNDKKDNKTTTTSADSATAISEATYRCDGKVAFKVKFDIGKVYYTMLDETIELREEATETPSGTRYSDGETILWLQGKEAMVEISGVSPFSSCETLKRKN